MSIGEGMGKTLGIGVLIAGAIGALWLFKDQMAGWFGSAIAAPISGAVGGVVSAAQEATRPVYEDVNAPLLPQTAPDAPNISFHDVVGMSVPGFGIVNVVGKLKEVYDYLLTGPAPEPPAPPADTFVSAPQPIPTEADILWQAAVAEVSPPSTSPPPGAWEQRGTSLLGAPLYRPAFGKVGELHYTKDGEFYSGDIWIAGGTNPEYYIVPTGHSLSSGGFKLGTFEAMADRYYGISDYDIVWM